MSKKTKYLVSTQTVVRAIEGDTEAFNELYKAYFNMIRFITSQFTRNESEAIDLTQDIFVKILNNIKSLDQPRAIHNWILRITYNHCFNYNNRSKTKTVDFGEENSIENIADSKRKKISEQIEDERIVSIVRQSLETMDSTLQSVGMMRYLDEMDLNEIASILEIPKGTVKSRLSRVRKILQKDLKEHGVSPATYRVVVSPVVLCGIYQIIYQQSIDKSYDRSIVYVVLASLFQFNVKQIAVVLGTLSLIVGGIFVSTQSDDTGIEEITPTQIEKPSEAVISNAEIVSINYNLNWTNEAILIEVETSNDNYHQILINENESMYISANGEYTVSLYKDGEVIDKKIIVIDNIDIHSPDGYSERRGNQYILYLNDDLSQVDSTSILYYKNGALSTAYIFDNQNKTITITSEKGDTELLYVSDNAGNVLQIDIYKE